VASLRSTYAQGISINVDGGIYVESRVSAKSGPASGGQPLCHSSVAKISKILQSKSGGFIVLEVGFEPFSAHTGFKKKFPLTGLGIVFKGLKKNEFPGPTAFGGSDPACIVLL
jgi:hypothetical protein